MFFRAFTYRVILFFGVLGAFSSSVHAGPFQRAFSDRCLMPVHTTIEEDRIRLARDSAMTQKISEEIRARGIQPVKLNPIPMLSQEVEMAGRYLESPSQLQNLSPGLYLYVIDVKGRVFFARRLVEGGKADQYLVSHRSIMNFMEKVTGEKATLVVGGEFEVVKDEAGTPHLYSQDGTETRIADLNNKMGSGHTNRPELEFAGEVMIWKGLPVEEGTPLRDMGNKDIAGAHFKEVKELGNLRMLMQAPAYRPLLAKADRIVAKIARRFPSEVPGKADLYAFQAESFKLYEEYVRSDARRYTVGVYFFHIQDPRERYGRLMNLVNQFGVKTVSSELDWIESLIK